MTAEVRTVAIVQARMGSSRFPGKMVAILGNISILEWVLKRLSRSTCLDEIVLATSIDGANDVLEDIANRYGVTVFRGSEDNVLSRFISAADKAKATNIVRICADNPFVDPVEVDRLVNFFKQNACDYACNHQDRLGSGYADGFGAEIFSLSLLSEIKNFTNAKDDCEHVTLYLWKNPKKYVVKTILAPADIARPELRFDVDTKDDLERLRKIVSLGVNIESHAAEIIKKSEEVGL